MKLLQEAQGEVIGFSVKGHLQYVLKTLWEELLGPVPPPDFNSNACTWSPDRFKGYDHAVACHWHDWHYNERSGVPRNRQGRLFADSTFRENIKIVLVEQGANFRARARAWIYYQAVRRAGAHAFYKDGFPEDDKPPFFQFSWAFKLMKKVF